MKKEGCDRPVNVGVVKNRSGWILHEYIDIPNFIPFGGNNMPYYAYYMPSKEV